VITRAFHCSPSNNSLEFHPCPPELRKDDQVKPIVVLFGWLLAKSRHLEKYGSIYQKHGADVMTVKLEVSEVSIHVHQSHVQTIKQVQN
jgi:hypothetical protein